MFYGLEFRAKSSILTTCACSSAGLERRSPEPKVARSNRARRTTSNSIAYSQSRYQQKGQKWASINTHQQLSCVCKKLPASRRHPAPLGHCRFRPIRVSSAGVRLHDLQLPRTYGTSEESVDISESIATGCWNKNPITADQANAFVVSLVLSRF